MPVAPSLTAQSVNGATPTLTIGVLSSFPPTPCGVATFSAALTAGFSALGAAVRVVRVADGSPSRARRVVGEVVNGKPKSVAAASRLLNECDVVVVQHEYGLYGGKDGDEVLDILGSLEVPAILIAHTVLSEPTAHQRSVLVAAAMLAERVVVMSQAAHDRLCNGFGVDAAKVATIPHGAATPGRRSAGIALGRPMLLTWGLVGPGKGIERVIDAMPRLQNLRSRPRYRVVGSTHPKVLAADGETYRNARIQQAWRNGVAASVAFDPTYHDVASLTATIQSSAVVVLPYDSRDQATSGVLVDAVAAGRPVVATAFPHAVELLASGAGIVVDHDDPEAMVLALHRLLTEHDLAASMAAEAARLAPSLGWPVVAAAYLKLADRVLAERRALV